MKKAGLIATVAFFGGVVIGLPLLIGLYIGSVITKMLWGFSIF